MTLPPSNTAPLAIRALARIVREGVAYGRGPRMKVVRRYYKPLIKKEFKQLPRPKRRVSLERQAASGMVFRRGAVTLQCLYPGPEGLQLPATWSAQFVERITFPVIRKAITHEQHPFRLALEIQRGSLKIKINVHDAKDQWLGPTFKAKLRAFAFPHVPPLASGTYIVFGDKVSDLTLCQWLTVILAQRSLLTEEEEREAVEQFFAVGTDGSEWAVRWKAYRDVKNTFVQPMGGHPSFSSYYRRTLKILRMRQSVEGRGIVPDAGNELSLRKLRWSEPNLHRAILDRIATGQVKPIERDGNRYVTNSVAERVDLERQRNAEARHPKRFPGKRVAWINRLVSKGERRVSATRKIKRWINDLCLSEEEVEASIRKGRVVRLRGSSKTS